MLTAFWQHQWTVRETFALVVGAWAVGYLVIGPAWAAIKRRLRGR